jgi:hypothetical protein
MLYLNNRPRPINTQILYPNQKYFIIGAIARLAVAARLTPFDVTEVLFATNSVLILSLTPTKFTFPRGFRAPVHNQSHQNRKERVTDAEYPSTPC